MCEATMIAMGVAKGTAASIASATAAASAVASVASVGMSIMGANQQAKAQQEQANYQSSVERNNAIIAERNAVMIEKQGEQEANRFRRSVREMIADQTVSLAANGSDITVGSNVDLLADTAELGELDAQTIEGNTERKAYNARVGGANSTNQASLYTAKANAQSPGFAGASAGFSQFATVGSQWARYKN